MRALFRLAFDSMFRHLVRDDGGLLQPPAAYVAVALAVLALCTFAYRAWTADTRPTEGTWICWECRGSVRIDPRDVASLPAECQNCGKTSLVPAFSCPSCRSAVALNEYRSLDPPTKCPQCGAEVWYGR